MRTFLFCLFLTLSTFQISYAQQGQKKKIESTTPVYEIKGPIEFKQMMQKKPGILIDVRTASEQKKGIIEGARMLDIFSDNFELELDKLDRNKTYYVYCAAGGRSAEACDIMKRKGFMHVVDLEGGFTRWNSENLPIILPTNK
jgi:phage shock protein E